MALNLYDFIKTRDYESSCKSLKENETKIIYSDNNSDIEVMKIKNRTLTFVNSYGNKDLNEVLNNICSRI